MNRNPLVNRELQQQLLEAIYDTLGPAPLYAENARNYIELGDMAGLQYSIQGLVAHTRSIAASFNELAKLRAGDGEGK